MLCRQFTILVFFVLIDFKSMAYAQNSCSVKIPKIRSEVVVPSEDSTDNVEINLYAEDLNSDNLGEALKTNTTNTNSLPEIAKEISMQMAIKEKREEFAAKFTLFTATESGTNKLTPLTVKETFERCANVNALPLTYLEAKYFETYLFDILTNQFESSDRRCFWVSDEIFQKNMRFIPLKLTLSGPIWNEPETLKTMACLDPQNHGLRYERVNTNQEPDKKTYALCAKLNKLMNAADTFDKFNQSYDSIINNPEDVPEFLGQQSVEDVINENRPQLVLNYTGGPFFKSLYSDKSTFLAEKAKLRQLFVYVNNEFGNEALANMISIAGGTRSCSYLEQISSRDNPKVSWADLFQIKYLANNNGDSYNVNVRTRKGMERNLKYCSIRAAGLLEAISTPSLSQNMRNRSIIGSSAPNLCSSELYAGSDKWLISNWSQGYCHVNGWFDYIPLLGTAKHFAEAISAANAGSDHVQVLLFEGMLSGTFDLFGGKIIETVLKPVKAAGKALVASSAARSGKVALSGLANKFVNLSQRAIETIPKWSNLGSESSRLLDPILAQKIDASLMHLTTDSLSQLLPPKAGITEWKNLLDNSGFKTVIRKDMLYVSNLPTFSSTNSILRDLHLGIKLQTRNGSGFALNFNPQYTAYSKLGSVFFSQELLTTYSSQFKTVLGHEWQHSLEYTRRIMGRVSKYSADVLGAGVSTIKGYTNYFSFDEIIAYRTSTFLALKKLRLILEFNPFMEKMSYNRVKSMNSEALTHSVLELNETCSYFINFLKQVRRTAESMNIEKISIIDAPISTLTGGKIAVVPLENGQKLVYNVFNKFQTFGADEAAVDLTVAGKSVMQKLKEKWIAESKGALKRMEEVIEIGADDAVLVKNGEKPFAEVIENIRKALADTTAILRQEIPFEAPLSIP